jgi:hypothetical protein
VPAESERFRRRLRGRDWWFLGLVAAVALAAIGVPVLLGHTGGSGSDAGCVTYSHPNFTGGATYRYCGAQAALFCRGVSAAADPGIAAKCAALGLRTRP